MQREAKALIVSCGFDFCVNNECGKCRLDKINLSIDGLCENSFDRSKLSVAEAVLKQYPNRKMS